MKSTRDSELEQPKSGIAEVITKIADIAANGIPIGKNARLVAKVEDMNYGDYKAKPAAVVGISFEF